MSDDKIILQSFYTIKTKSIEREKKKNRWGGRGTENKIEEKGIEYVMTLYCFAYSFVLCRERNCQEPSSTSFGVKTRDSLSIYRYVCKSFFMFFCESNFLESFVKA